MCSRLPVLGLVVALCLSSEAPAQSVLIHHSTSAAVVERLKTDVLPQGFTLRNAGDKSALFALDRGNVIQRDGRVVHVVLELTVRFKHKDEGLEVTASEEAVGTATAGMDFRRPVESPAERNNLQRLLDRVRTDLEARPLPLDSGAKRDSSRL